MMRYMRNFSQTSSLKKAETKQRSTQYFIEGSRQCGGREYIEGKMEVGWLDGQLGKSQLIGTLICIHIHLNTCRYETK